MAIPYSNSSSLVSNSTYYSAFANLNKTYNLPVSAGGLTSSQKSQLETALNTAKATGDKWWEKAINFTLKYGPEVLGVLTSTGIIKNKNLENVIVGDVDAEKSADLESLGKAYEGRNANEGEGSGKTIKIFGIELTPINLIILIVALILIYNQFSNSGKK